MPRSKTAIAFAIVVALCLAQVAWWIVFQFRESEHFEAAAEALVAGDYDAVAEALGVGADGAPDDRFHRRRFMFASEGVFLGVCAGLGVVFFYAMLLRERRVYRERERFLTGATHEFKTPLATLQLGLQSMLDERVTAETRMEYLHAMLQEVSRLERGVGNLLAAAGLRQSVRGLDRPVGDLADDIGEVVAEFEPRFRTAGIDLEARLAPGVRVARDRAGLRLVVHNLLDNALRYVERGGTVVVQLRRDGPDAELVVEDDGIGIDPTDAGRIFEPFFRGSRGQHVGGSGLGLHLAREFVEQHRGTIRLVETDGPGAKFVVRLPVARGES
ncbi:MAG: HAMP domain-containing histidine kinase [Planctomycetes bacterium]|nr:HAMP domain-containing histidine kinase [Planctomycetota bacterium]